MSSNDEIRQNRVCQACEKSIDPSDLASMQCGHTFHYQCLQVLLGDQIKAKHYPVCCPIQDCLVEPSMYFMSVVLDDPEFEKYIALEKDSIQSFQSYSCAACNSTFLAYPTSKTHKCLKCSTTVCLSCSDIAHPGKTCRQKVIKTCANHLETQTSDKITLSTMASPLVGRRSTAKFTAASVSSSVISTSANTPVASSSSSLKSSTKLSKVGSKKIITSTISPIYIAGDKSASKTIERPSIYISATKHLPILKQQSKNNSTSSSSSQSSLTGLQQLASEEKEGVPRSDPELGSTKAVGIPITRRAFSSYQFDNRVENCVA